MYYAQIDADNICTGVSQLAAATESPDLVPISTYDTSLIGQRWTGDEWEAVPEPPAPPSPTEWLIDVGPFFDRFGAAKLSVLASADATVRALVADLQVRRWIDLRRADVAQGIDLLISKGIGVTAAMKESILTSPVTVEENLALRKTYFS
jgi:hypothetical protein